MKLAIPGNLHLQLSFACQISYPRIKESQIGNGEVFQVRPLYGPPVQEIEFRKEFIANYGQELVCLQTHLFPISPSSCVVESSIA